MFFAIFKNGFAYWVLVVKGYFFYYSFLSLAILFADLVFAEKTAAKFREGSSLVFSSFPPKTLCENHKFVKESKKFIFYFPRLPSMI